MMSPDKDPSDPLLAAIGELRRELIGWIDSRLGPLRDQGRETAAPAAFQPAPPVGPAIPARLRPPPGARSQPSPPAADAGDPRHRLDALARRLGEQLRLAEPSGGEPDEPRAHA
ncbi:hypothetical protein [Aquisphaera giovannonii]|nr:hypothetical protein [Aquisphaera giovannonii]